MVAQAKAKEVSRGGANGDADNPINKVVIDVHLSNELESIRRVPATDDTPKYTDAVVEGSILSIIKDGAVVDEVAEGTAGYFGVLLDRTNFYAEAGGQLYDTGAITIDGQMEFAVEAVQSYRGYVLHIGYLKYGRLAVGDRVVAAFDETRRRPLRANHTATHLLNYAMGRVLDQRPDQCGSLVAPDRLRFDYNSAKALTLEQVDQIEKIVTRFIEKGFVVSTKLIPRDEAMALPGVRAMFGEDYPDMARVVCVGGDLSEIVANPADARWSEVSTELCGGTHVAKSSDIRAFIILSEGAIAKGIRRIVAVTGDEAVKAVQVEADLSMRLDALAKVKDVSNARDEAVKTLAKALDEANISLIGKSRLRDQLAAIRKEIEDADKAVRAAQSKKAIETVISAMGDHPLLIKRLEVGDNNKALLDALNALKKEGRSGLLCSVDALNNKIHYQCMVADAHKGILNAAEVARTFGDAIGGKSGGKDTMAQGSAPLCDTQEAEQLALRFALMKFEHTA